MAILGVSSSICDFPRALGHWVSSRLRELCSKCHSLSVHQDTTHCHQHLTQASLPTDLSGLGWLLIHHLLASSPKSILAESAPWSDWLRKLQETALKAEQYSLCTAWQSLQVLTPRLKCPHAAGLSAGKFLLQSLQNYPMQLVKQRALQQFRTHWSALRWPQQLAVQPWAGLSLPTRPQRQLGWKTAKTSTWEIRQNRLFRTPAASWSRRPGRKLLRA